MKSLQILRSGACGALLCVAMSVFAAPRYTLSALADPAGGPEGILQLGGFNDAGQLAGTWVTAGIDAAPFLYTPGQGFTNLLPAGQAPSGFFESRVGGLNDSGQVVGSYRGQAWQFGPGGGAVPGTGASASATAINNAGQVIGSTGDSAYLHTPGQGTQPLLEGGWAMDISNTGQVLLGQGTGPLTLLYRYDIASGAITPVPMDPALDPAMVAALNDRGDVMASQGLRLGLEVVVYHPDGTATTVPGLFDGSSNQGADINDLGQVIGRSLRDGPLPFDPLPFLYTPGEGTTDLVALIDPAALQGWSGLDPAFINDHGDIAGVGLFNGERTVFVLNAVAAPVPEPASALLLALGLGGVGVGVRRQRSVSRSTAAAIAR